MMSNDNEIARAIEMRTTFIKHMLRKCCSAIQRKSKRVYTKIKRKIQKSMKRIKEIICICSTDSSTAAQNVQIQQSNGLLLEAKEESMHWQEVESILFGYISEKEQKEELREKHALSEEYTKSLDELEEFIAQMQAILEQTMHMRETVQVALVLFFYLVHNKYTISQTLQEAEKAYHKSDKADKMDCMDNGVVIYLVVRCMQLSPNTNYFISQQESLKQAYLLLQGKVVASLVERRKNRCQSKEGIMFYIAVAECMREVIEQKLNQAELLYNKAKEGMLLEDALDKYEQSNKECFYDIYKYPESEPMELDEIVAPEKTMKELMTSPLFRRIRKRNIKNGTVQEKNASALLPEEVEERERGLVYIKNTGVPTPIIRCIQLEK